jgi:phosphoglycolate phosphatase
VRLQPTLPPIQAIVFDFDGTLAATDIDFAGVRAELRSFYISRGVWDESLSQRYILEMIDGVCSRLNETQADQLRTESMAIVGRIESEACSRAEPYPGVPEALATLQERGYRLGIFTRNSREGCDLVLRRHPLPHSVLLTREDVVNVKPHPEHLREALARLDCPPDKALVVGDHPTDAETAVAAGACAVGVLTTNATEEALLAAGASLVLDSAAELPAVVPTTPG